MTIATNLNKGCKDKGHVFVGLYTCGDTYNGKKYFCEFCKSKAKQHKETCEMMIKDLCSRSWKLDDCAVRLSNKMDKDECKCYFCKLHTKYQKEIALLNEGVLKNGEQNVK